MSYCKSDMTIDQLLADPLIQTVMKADRVDVTQLATMLRTTARGIGGKYAAEKFFRLVVWWKCSPPTTA